MFDGVNVAGSWTIGQLADAVGTTVRALRHYDRLGLVPASRNSSGHRRYRPGDVVRVRRILALREVGLSLAEIGEVIDGDEALLGSLIRARRRELDRRLAEMELNRRRLRAAEDATEDSVLSALEDIMRGPTFTPEQLERLKARHSSSALTDWTSRARDLDQTVRGLLEVGAAPTSDRATAAARRWLELLSEMAADDPVIEAAIVAKLDRRGADSATHGAMSEQTWSFLRSVPVG
jgi:MerR family transcriptional regulator, thiopeptide resistance regulator